jgi:acyl-CoA thioesterase-1
VSCDLRVCFIGDSFVAGVGDPDHLGWVGRLAARTEREGQPVTAYNLGVRRQTSADVLARWHAECSQRLPAAVDARVVVSLGVNDTTHEDGGPRVRPIDSVAHLGALLRGAAAAGWAAFVVGPPPVSDTAQNQRTAALDSAFADVCHGAGVRYVGVFDDLLGNATWMRQVGEGDGAHPAAAGYQVLADLVWPHWRGWLSTA